MWGGLTSGMKSEECNRFCECPCIADGTAKILDNHGTALIVQMPCGKQWIFKDRLEWYGGKEGGP